MSLDRIVVSNIAWTNEEESKLAKSLQKMGISKVEIAPTKIWQDPTKATTGQIEQYIDFWSSHDIEVVAFQSMLFNRPDLKIFENEGLRNETKEYLNNFIVLAGKMGARAMVFGSPKNRQKNGLTTQQADEIAIEFFNELGNTAQAHNTIFCLEPNPTDYACDYVTTAQQGIDLVTKVDNPGFGLHLDIAGMTLAGDNIAENIQASADVLCHFHASSPFLEQVENNEIKHEEAAAALGSIGYKGFVSIEMKPYPEGENIGRVEKAVAHTASVYGSHLS